MKKCPNCGSVYWNSIENCLDCGIPLLPYTSSATPEASRVFKNIVVILAVLFLIAGVVSGFVFKTVDDNSFFSEERFNYILMISVWLSGVFPVIISYAAYAHFRNQESLISIGLQIRDKLPNANPVEDKPDKTEGSTQAPTEVSHKKETELNTSDDTYLSTPNDIIQKLKNNQ